MATEQALDRPAEKTPAVITTPTEYTGALARWQSSGLNILTPFTNISGLAPSYGIISSLVTINPDPDKGDAYFNKAFMKHGEVALAKIGLHKIAECAAISTSTERTDPRTISHFWEFKAKGSYRGVDGTIVTREATQEWDLRDGSPRLNGWTPQQISEGRKNGLRNCEERAINAVIRECGCGIKQKYTQAELARPFVVIRVAFQADMNDPAIKAMVTHAALGGTTALYPQAPRELPSVEIVERPANGNGNGQPKSAGSGTTAAAAEPAKPAVEPPPVDGAVKIVKVYSEDGVSAKGRKWVKHFIVDSNGVIHETFDDGHETDAQRFLLEKAWVEIVEERRGEFTNIIEIVKAGSAPNLPGLDRV